MKKCSGILSFSDDVMYSLCTVRKKNWSELGCCHSYATVGSTDVDGGCCYATPKAVTQSIKQQLSHNQNIASLVQFLDVRFSQICLTDIIFRVKLLLATMRPNEFEWMGLDNKLLVRDVFII